MTPSRINPSEKSAEELAHACVRARDQLRRASRVLHDEVGSMLAVAGLRLQMLRMDHPEAEQRSTELAEVLDGAMETVRRLSREVDPSPAARTGLKNALLDLAEKNMSAFPGGIAVRCTVTATLPPVVWDALYVAAARTIEAAATRNTRHLSVTAAGAKTVSLRITHPGPASRARRDLHAAAIMARAAGLEFETASGTEKTKESTIVVIRYAHRRPPRG